MTHSFPTRRSSDLREQWAVPLGRWFVRFLKNQGIEGQRLGMHSFRHNFQDRLREAGLHGTPIGQELAGRAKSGNTENRSEEHTSELQSLMRNSYAVSCLQKKNTHNNTKYCVKSQYLMTKNTI